jgi:hypothetical protein
MCYSSQLRDELQALKGDVSRLLNTTSEGILDASKDRAGALAAGILLVIAARPPGGRELELASEIHASSIVALQLEARALQSQLSGVVHHPLNGILPLLMAPLITIIIKSLKKPAAATAAAAEPE